ncbi:alpha-amylase family glycosyl hydrolase [Marinifilum flexuosum]|uniref:DUF4961 domain-containing protein n=1 Tax=Marinifilum flexuosum TaxID=1117708 RepID=UPI0024918BF7|nr:alpha-amylase family glycosyl hydrolase [Marinifilum flexuosum]
MRKTLLLFILLTGYLLNGMAQRVWVEPSNATINDEITIYFDKETSSFWTDGEARIYMHAGVNTNAGHWQNVNDAFSNLNDSQEMTAHEGAKVWKKTITPKEYFSLSEGTTVYSIDLKFRNQYGGGGNNETGNFEISLTEAHVNHSGKEITSFSINGDAAQISGDQIALQIDAGTDITSLSPVIVVSEHASVSPASGVAQDFSSPVQYTVTAEDGNQQVYTVTISQLSIAKDITRFTVDGIDATIGENIINLELPYNTSVDISQVTPTIEISPKASISPLSGVARDFTNPQTYTLTAENNSTKDYTVSITIADPPVVVTSPENPSADQQVSITFNAKGTALENASKVYLHYGVSTTSGEKEWIGNWGEDDNVGIMTQGSSANQWTFSFTPTSDFASLLPGEEVTGLEFLFRSADGTLKEDNSGSNYSLSLQAASIPDWIEISPALPKISDEITITFRPSIAPGKKLQAASSIYMHSWAVTSGPGKTTADYVGQAQWGDNTKGQLTEISSGVWQITLTPSTYFGISDQNENLFRIGLLFRNQDGSVVQKNEEDKDYYLETDPEFYISIVHPNDQEKTVETETSFEINFTTSESASVEVFADNQSIHTASSVTTNSVNHSFTTAGSHTILIRANNGSTIKEKTIAMEAYSSVTVEDLPSWVKTGQKGIIYHKNIDGLADDDTKATLILHTPTSITYKDGYGNVYGSQSVPAKSVVHVLGDFNNWSASENSKMKKTTDGNYWWITLEGLTAGQEYIFQYLIDGYLQLADPYTEKVSDPDDQYISSSTYPGLISYPSGNASDRASVLQTEQSDYQWQVSNFTVPSHNDLNVYELHIRDFTTEGNYKAAAEKLDYLKDMGINCIHLMPVSEFEGNDSWGYNPNFYFAPDKAYGTKNDLKSFIDQAHEKGIAVINDMVLNHSFYSSPLAKMYWNSTDNRPAVHNPWYNENHNFQNPGAHWGADFNHTSEHTQNLVDSILNFWIDEYHFDGFRFDFTKGFSNTSYPEDSWGSTYDAQRIGILKRMVGSMRSKHPGTIAVFEHLADASEDSELANEGILMWGGKGISEKYEELAMGWSGNIDLSQAYYRNISYQYANLMSYMESHDEERLAFKAMKYGRDINAGSFDKYQEPTDDQLQIIVPRLKAAAAFNLLLPGARMVWQFGELGYDYSIDYNGRTGKKPVRWDYFENAHRKGLYEFYADLFHLRNTYNLYNNDQTQDFDISGAMKRITLNGKTKSDEGFQLIVIGNFGESDGNITPHFGSTGTWYNFEDGSNINVSSTSQQYYLKRGEYKILCSRQLSRANFHQPSIESVQAISVDENSSLTFLPEWFTVKDDDNDPAAVYTFTYLGGDNYTVSNSTLTPAPYFFGDLQVKAQVSDGKYTSEEFSFTLSVNPIQHPLTITAQDASMTYGNPLPDFTVTYEGFVHDHTSDDLEGTLSFNVEGDDIVPSGLSSTHYDITYVPGKLTVNKATPTVSTWPTASTITYGQTLSESILTGGTANVDGSFAFANPSATPDAGTQAVEIIFTPTDDSNYNTVSGNINITVDKADATVSAWPTAGAITYGQTLSESILTGGTANVDGSFAFANPSATPDAGTQAVEIIFTPTDDSNYNTVSGNINITVDKADATVSAWPTAGAITYGQALSESILTGGTANVDGSFAFENPSATPNAGTQSVEVTFTPTDNSNYNTASGNINITVDKANVTVSVWPTAGTITYGQTLSESILTGGTASVDGSFAFANPSATPNAGTQSVEIIFTPTDNSNYNTASGNINITVDKADVIVSTWSEAGTITYGQALSESILTGGTANVDGSFAFANPSSTLNAGTQSVEIIFTPTDASNYNTQSGNINIIVDKADVTVSVWPMAGTITYGQTLSESILTGGTAHVDGSFAFANPSATPNAGTQTVEVIFTPTDNSNYNTVSGNINITVDKADVTVSAWPTAGAITYGQTLSESILTGGTANVDGSFAFANPSATPNAGTQSVEIIFTPTDNSNYNTVSGNINIIIDKADVTVSAWPAASTITYEQALSESILTGGTANVDGSFAFANPSATPNAGTQTVEVIFTPTDNSNYNTVSGNINITVDKADVTVSAWPAAGTITYGQALSESTLTGGTANVDGSFAFAHPSATPNAGTQTVEVIFTPTDNSNYNTVSGNINITVDKADVTVSAWPTAGAITYGQALSESTLTGGTANVDGSFAFANPSATPNAGTQTVEVIFTPTDNSNYNTVSGNINITVDKADVTVSAWPTAGAITYGQALSESTLTGGTANVDGSFAFANPSATPNAGTQSVEIIFTPTDNSNYNTVSGNININVDKADATVSAWPAASTITYGQALSESILTGGTANVDGSFAFANPSATPNAGTQSVEVIFTPTDNSNYNTVSGNINITVDKADVTVNVWPTAGTITYGQALSESILMGGTASVDGSFAFANPSATPNAGTQAVEIIFTPTDASNYNAVSGNINITVDKANVTVSVWPTAGTITYGQALSESILTGGTANVDGNFAFANPSATPNAGTQSVEIIFTPTDDSNYNTVSGNINITVDKADVTVSVWPTAGAITYRQALSESTLTGGTASVDGSFAFANPSATPNAGTQEVEVIFTPTDNSNYNTVSGNINITVDKADATVSAWPLASTIAYGQTLSESILTGGTANVDGSFAFANPSSTPNAGTQSMEVIFTPTDNSNYNTVSGNINITVDKADVTVSAWPTAGAITYGQALSESILMGGTASVDGSFAFANPSATPNAGTQSVEIIFTPTDASNYNTVSGNINITVDKANVTVSVWPTAGTITYGQALSESILTGGTANVDGSFAFANPSATPDAGIQSVEVIFTPSDADNYNSVRGNISISVTKESTVVTNWPTASAISYGQSLSESTLSGGTANVDGSFAFANPSATPDAGTQSVEVIFTPSDTDNYNTVSETIGISVSKATPTVSVWPIADAITYGQTLSESTLSGGTANVDGSFAFANPSATPDAGAQSVEVIFTPNNSDNYNSVSKLISISIDKADQNIVWDQDLSSLMIDDQVQLTAIAETALPVSYSISDEDIALIEGDLLTILEAGELTITATQEGNQNYNPVEVSRIITIEVVTGIDDGINKSIELKAYPNPVQRKVTIDGLQRGDKIALYNQLGKMILTKDVQNNKEVFDLSDCKPGMYLFKVVGGKSIRILKI